MSSTNICIICAWREECQKKFSVSGKDIRCTEFEKDLRIKEDKSEEETSSEDKQKK